MLGRAQQQLIIGVADIASFEQDCRRFGGAQYVERGKPMRIGAQVELPQEMDPFGEAPGRAFIVSGSAEALAELPIIGQVGGAELRIDGQLSLAVSELTQAYEGGLERFV